MQSVGATIYSRGVCVRRHVGSVSRITRFKIILLFSHIRCELKGYRECKTTIDVCFKIIKYIKPQFFTADFASYSYGKEHVMRPARVQMTNDLIRAYNLDQAMICSVSITFL